MDKEQIFVEEMTWQEFDRRRREIHTVILPMGAVECYGPHLPMSTDIKVARAVAELVARRTGALVGPSLSVGDSASISVFPGTLRVRPESFKEYLRDVIESFLSWGMRNFLFLNGHAGNVPMVSQLSNEFLLRDRSMRFAQIDWWRYVAARSGGILEGNGYMAQGHASECGTSVMLYLFPDSVRRDKIRCSIPQVVNGKRFPGVNRSTLFDEFSPEGMIGDATKATGEKGRLLVERCVEDIVAYMRADFDEIT